MIKSGVYIIHGLERRVYIGSAKDLKRRWTAHKTELRGCYHGNIPLQIDWLQFEEHDFYHEVLEYCSIDMLEVREQYWLNYALPNVYNIELIVGRAGYGRQVPVNHNGVMYISISDFARAYNADSSRVNYLINNGYTPEQVVEQLKKGYGKGNNRTAIGGYKSVREYAAAVGVTTTAVYDLRNRGFSDDEIVEKIKTGLVSKIKVKLDTGEEFESIRQFAVVQGVGEADVRGHRKRGKSYDEIVEFYKNKRLTIKR